jgi:hypothetical protein
VLVEPQPGDVAGRGLVEDGLGRGAEGRPLGPEDEPLQLGGEVEARVGLDQVVDQPHGQPPGGQPDLVVAVAVDHVVLAAGAGAAGLAPPLLAPGLALQLEGDVLGHVAQPGPLP